LRGCKASDGAALNQQRVAVAHGLLIDNPLQTQIDARMAGERPSVHAKRPLVLEQA
jgi:hypothetical protein